MGRRRVWGGVVAFLLGAGVLLSGRLAGAEEVEVLDHTLKGEVEIGGRHIFGDSRSSKFEEYREIRNSWFVDGLKLDAENKEQTRFYQFRAVDIEAEDQSYLLRLGRYGKYEVELGWDQIPHVFSNTGRSLFGGDPGNLTIPSSVRAALQAAASPLDTATIRSTVNANARDIDLRLRRDTGSFGFRYTPTPELDLRLSYAIEQREGTRPFGANMRTNVASTFNTIELPEPIDYLTHEVRAGVEYATAQWSLKLAYAASIFRNSLDSFTWDNPFRTTDNATLGAARGRHSLDPDNIAHNLSLSGAVNLPFGSRLMGTISYGWMRQDQAFLPSTTNSALAVAPSPLPASSPHAKIDTLLMDYALNTRLHRDVSLTARYRYYQLDNDTRELYFQDYVQADSLLVTTDRRNLAIGYTKQNAGLDAVWRPLSLVSLKTGYEWERYHRTERDVRFTDEHSEKAAIDVTPTDWLLLRASYLYAQRRFDEYDHQRFVRDYTYPAGEPGALGQHPSLRKFDLANRDRNRVEVLGQLSPLDALTFTVTFGLGKDDFKGVAYGITGDDNWSAAADIHYMPAPRIALFVSYTREEFKSKMRSRERGGAAGDTPANDWASDMKDFVDTVGAGLDLVLIPKRLDLKLAYSLSSATGEIRTRPLGTPTVVGFTAADWPNTTSRIHRLDTSLSYRLGANVSLRLSYVYERYLERDFATDVMQPYMEGTSNFNLDARRSIYLGATQPSYDAHIVGFSLRFKL